MVTHEELVVKSLWACRIDPPLMTLLAVRQRSYYNVEEDDRGLFDDTTSALAGWGLPPDKVLGFEPAWLRQEITVAFAAAGMELNLTYFDPSSSVRSVEANAFDSAYCLWLAHNAVHAARTRKTGVVASRWHGRFVLRPVPLAVRDRHPLDPNGDLGLAVLESTGRPPVLG